LHSEKTILASHRGGDIGDLRVATDPFGGGVCDCKSADTLIPRGLEV